MRTKPLAYRALRTVEKRMTKPVIGACVYEALALTFPSKYTPPITVLANRHKWVFPVFCGALGIHIWFFEEMPRALRIRLPGLRQAG